MTALTPEQIEECKRLRMALETADYFATPEGERQITMTRLARREMVTIAKAFRAAASEAEGLRAEVGRLRRELIAAIVADQEHGAGMSIILRNWRSRGKSDGDWRALDVSVQFGVGQPEISVISEYLCEGGVIDHAVHPSGIASARAKALTTPTPQPATQEGDQ